MASFQFDKILASAVIFFFFPPGDPWPSTTAAGGGRQGGAEGCSGESKEVWRGQREDDRHDHNHCVTVNFSLRTDKILIPQELLAGRESLRISKHEMQTT